MSIISGGLGLRSLLPMNPRFVMGYNIADNILGNVVNTAQILNGQRGSGALGLATTNIGTAANLGLIKTGTEKFGSFLQTTSKPFLQKLGYNAVIKAPFVNTLGSIFGTMGNLWDIGEGVYDLTHNNYKYGGIITPRDINKIKRYVNT